MFCLLVFIFVFCSLHATHAVSVVVVARHLLLLLPWCLSVVVFVVVAAFQSNVALTPKVKNELNLTDKRTVFQKLNETRRRSADADRAVGSAARSRAAKESAGVLFSGFTANLIRVGGIA